MGLALIAAVVFVVLMLARRRRAEAREPAAGPQADMKTAPTPGMMEAAPAYRDAPFKSYMSRQEILDPLQDSS